MAASPKPHTSLAQLLLPEIQALALTIGGSPAEWGTACTRIAEWDWGGKSELLVSALAGSLSSKANKDLREQLSASGLQRAHKYLGMVAQGSLRSGEMKRYLQQAEVALTEGRDQMYVALHAKNKNAWPLLLHASHLLAVVSYWLGSEFGRDVPAGYRRAVPILSELFRVFGERLQTINGQVINKAKDRAKLVAVYRDHAKHYEDVLRVAQQRGHVDIELVRDEKTQMVTDTTSQGGDGSHQLVQTASANERARRLALEQSTAAMEQETAAMDAELAATQQEILALGGAPPMPALAPVLWEWRDDGNTWRPYEPAICQQLEAALAADERTVNVDSSGERFVDLGAMRQARWDDPQRSRKVRRGAAAARGYVPPPAMNPAASAPDLAQVQQEPEPEPQPQPTAAALARRAKLRKQIKEQEATLQLLRLEGLTTGPLEASLARKRAELAALMA